MIRKYKLEAQLIRLKAVLGDIARLSALKRDIGLTPRQRLANINYIAEYEACNIETKPRKAEGGE